MAKKKTSFEEALLRLKEITETLERGDVTLEESIKLFGEGTTGLCRKQTRSIRR